MAKGDAKGKRVQACPMCGCVLNPLKDDFSVKWEALSDVFDCPRCGYSGVSVAVKASELKKANFKPKN